MNALWELLKCVGIISDSHWKAINGHSIPWGHGKSRKSKPDSVVLKKRWADSLTVKDTKDVFHMMNFREFLGGDL